MDKIIFSGNVGRDAEYSEKDGRGMAKFSVAVNKVVKGEKVTEWRNVTVFGKTAEFCGKYVTKGRTVLIAGAPSPRFYKSKLDETVACIDVIADTVELVGNKDAGNQSNAVPASAGTVVDPGEDMPF